MKRILRQEPRGIILIAVVVLAALLPPAAQSAGLYAITDLGTFGGGTSAANAINDLGQVVGSADLTNTSPTWTHAFLYSNGVMTDLGVLSTYVTGSGTYSMSMALGINNSGRIVGKSYTSLGRYHAFFYDEGQMTDLGVLPGNDQSQARSINDIGQIVGATEPSGPIQAFIYYNSAMTPVGTLGGTQSSAYGINNHGQIVGDSWVTNSGLSDTAFVYSNGTMQALGNLGNLTAIQGFAINDNGQITGYAGTGGSSTAVMRGFLLSGGTMTDLGNLGGLLTNVIPLAINNRAQIVGNISGAANASHAFLYSGGTMNLLDNLIDPDSGWTLIHATGINNNGQIVGSGRNPSFDTHAFLLTPRPNLQNLHLSAGCPQFDLLGMTGVTYRVEYALSLPATNWLALTNIVLASSPGQITDPSPLSTGPRFYRAVQPYGP
jgi:probable HAF family extracellular repeat protein